MSFPRLLVVLGLLAVALSPAQALEGPAKTEVDYLLGYIEKSGARFLRGGQEYTAAEGAAHMRTKLGRAGGRVKTADDFITGIGTKSYFSGDPYQIRTPEGQLLPTGPWLSAALAKHRAARQKP